MNAVSINTFGVNRSKKVEWKLWYLYVTTREDSAKASSLFGAINETLTKDGIEWNNTVTIGLVNTNANIGSWSSVKSRIKESKASVFDAGCSYYLPYLAGGRDGLAYKNRTNLDVKIHEVDLYCFFKNST